MKKKYHLLFIITFLFLTAVNTAQDIGWAKNAGGSGEDVSTSISTDVNGNSYITGYFEGAVLFGSIQLISNGAYDIFIAKYDANGKCVWAKNSGGIGSDLGNGISIDVNGNSYLTGYFEGTASFGTNQLISNGSGDIFIAKFDAFGDCIWAKNAGGTDSDRGNAISATINGNSYLTGYFRDTATFGTIQLVSSGSADMFVAKYDADGNCLWAKNSGGMGSDLGNGISLDANGNSYVTGSFFSDIFIAKYDLNGNSIWVKNVGNTLYDSGLGISTDESGNSYLTGTFSANVYFGAIQLVSNGSSDIFIAKYDLNGNCIWAKNAGGMSIDIGRSIFTDADGNSYVTGNFLGTATFGTIQLVSKGSEDIFIAKYNSNGNFVWAKNAGGIGSDFGNGISGAANGDSYFTGKFSATATIGTVQLFSNGAEDIYIAKILNGDVGFCRLEFYHNVGTASDNPRNYLNPGSHIRFKIKVKNILPNNLFTAYGKINCLTSSINVTDSLATYNNVLSGQEGWSVDDYEIYVPNTIEMGSHIEFLLTISQVIPPTGPWNSVFCFPIAPLSVSQIYLDDDQNPDSWGNNNKIPEPSETIEVIPLISNVSLDTIFFVNGRLSENLTDVTVWDNVMGVSGLVYDTWRYNVTSGVHQPIPSGSINIQPEQDYVFNYSNVSPYPSLPFSLNYSAYLNSEPDTSWDTGGILVRWTNPFYMTDGIVSTEEALNNTNFAPDNFALFQNYPNPFNPSTTISWQAPVSGWQTLKVYDILGNEVATLVDEYRNAGSYIEQFTINNVQLSSGVYFYQLRVGDFIQTKKMILLK